MVTFAVVSKLQLKYATRCLRMMTLLPDLPEMVASWIGVRNYQYTDMDLYVIAL